MFGNNVRSINKQSLRGKKISRKIANSSVCAFASIWDYGERLHRQKHKNSCANCTVLLIYGVCHFQSYNLFISCYYSATYWQKEREREGEKRFLKNNKMCETLGATKTEKLRVRREKNLQKKKILAGAAHGKRRAGESLRPRTCRWKWK